MSALHFSPQKAWLSYIKDSAVSQKWMEDSSSISNKLSLSKRELFGLILLAYIRNYQYKNENWYVGYNPEGEEPNDGFVSDGKITTFVEHKLISQMAEEPALKAILSTYDKYAKLGDAYGGNRLLIIFANIATQGMIKISSLRDKIEDKCSFDQVLLIHCVGMKNGTPTAIFHITEHYPTLGIAQVEFDFSTGSAVVPHCKIEPI